MSGLTLEVKRIHEIWMQHNESDYQQHAMINMHGLTDAEYFKDEPHPEYRRGCFFNRLAPENLVKIIQGVFGTALYFHNSQLFFNPFEGRRKPYWHRDMQYNGDSERVQQSFLESMLSLHIRIPLLDEVGIELIPGTHKRWDTRLERNVRLQLNGNDNQQSLPGSKLINLKAGDALIFSAQMIHRGHYSQPQRLALDLCIGKPHPSTIKYLNNNHLPLESEMQYINFPNWFNRNGKLSIT